MFRIILLHSLLVITTLAERPGLFLGRGYDVVLGDPLFFHPEAQIAGAATDPGLKANPVLEGVEEHEELNLAEDGKFACRTGKDMTLSLNMFRDRILHMFHNTDGWHTFLKEHAISAAANEKFPEDRIYFETYRKCTNGKRHTVEDLGMDRVSDDFRRAVCALPDKVDADKYQQFIASYGTSVITSVVMGFLGYSRYSKTYTKLNSFYDNLILGEPEFEDHKEYIRLTRNLVSNLDEGEVTRDPEGRVQFTIGDSSLPSMVELGVQNIDTFIQASYWPACQQDGDKCCSRLPGLKKNVITALKKYPDRLGLRLSKKSSEPPKFRVYWPQGTYSLVETGSGCPVYTGFDWQSGTVQHTQGSQALNSDSSHANPQIHTTTIQKLTYALPREFKSTVTIGGKYRRKAVNVVRQQFCSKTNSSTYDTYQHERPWPAGSYCIHKLGTCPDGFEEGWIYWDDFHLANANSVSGVVPDGVYDQNTQIYFCCREDADPETEIILPISKPFFLMRRGGTCQKVRWTSVIDGSVYYDSSWLTSGYAYSYFNSGKHPDNDMSGSNHNLHYCYYTRNE